MQVQSISASEARRLIGDGAVLVDVREPSEHARERIPGSRLAPLSALDRSDVRCRDGKPVIFHCQSGARTNANATRLAARLGPDCQAFVMAGGIEAWRRTGLPTATGSPA